MASASPNADYSANLTSRKLHLLTTFQLRQELTKRGCLDIPEDRINHRTLLERLMTEVIKDEQAEVAAKTAEVALADAMKREEARKLREEKKREALERSKARTESAAYFEEKKKANELKLVEKGGASDVSGGGSEKNTSIESVEDDTNDNNDDGDDDDDPFRAVQSKKNRNKIFVK